MSATLISRFSQSSFSYVRAVCLLCLFLFSMSAFGAVYDIGPGQTYTTINSFPWYTLQAGDTVQIHYATYHEFISVTSRGTASQPIRIVGIPDPATGNQPVIDGQNAVVGPNAHMQFTEGSPVRGLVSVGPSSNAPANFKPGYVEISGLTVQNAYGGDLHGTGAYSLTAADGVVEKYNGNSAAIYLVNAEHVVVTNCTMRGSSNGFYTNEGSGTEATTTRDVTLQYSRVYGNGTPGTETQHNVYTAAIGIVFQYNYIGPLVAGGEGSGIKDRSAGTVIRYNWIESSVNAGAVGGHMIDLVDAQIANNTIQPTIYTQDPTYNDVFVYGNILHNTTTQSMVHYGGDQGIRANDRNGTIYFYNNTVIVQADQRPLLYQTVLLQLTDQALGTQTLMQHGDVRNNLIYVEPLTPGSTPSLFDFGADGPNAIYANWVSPKWQAGYNLPSSPNVTGTGNLFVDMSNNPSFVDVANGDYRLLAGSNAIDKSVALAPAVTSNPAGQDYSVKRQYVKDVAQQVRQVNGTALDFGAFENGPAGACTYVVYPTSITAGYAGGNGTLEVTPDSGCSWSASANDSWLSIVSGASGTGIGNVEYSVQSNGGAARSGSLTVAGQTVPVNQLIYDVTPPTVAITSPSDGASVTGTVSLAASASDNVAVTSVQFQLNGAPFGATLATPPYTASWDTTSYAPGHYAITAVATDASANAATSPAVTVTVANPFINGASVTYSGSTVFSSHFLPSPQNGTFTLQGDVIPAGDNTTTPTENGLFALSNNASAALTDLAAIVLFDVTGLVEVRNGSAYVTTQPFSYVAGHSYHVRMQVNVPTHTYDVYITPAGGAEVQIASGYAFRSEQATVPQLDHWVLASNGNSITASNVSVSGTNQTSTPYFTPTPGNYTSAQTVTIATTTPSATIYYTTDGTTPTASSTVYTGPITVSASETIKAIATVSGLDDSSVATGIYGIVVATPTFSPAAGSYTSNQTVSISDSTPSSTIYYTTNGTTPTSSSTVYTGPIVVSSNETIKAIGIATGYSPSAVASAAYLIQPYAAVPVFSPGTGTYNTPQTVTISSTTPSATIYYTTNGATPTISSTVYAGPITVSSTETVKAIAAATGFTPSPASSATYTLVAATPVFSPVPMPGTYTTPQTVTISSTTPSTTIYYTTDGSTPTTSSTVYTTPIFIPITETLKAIAVATGYTTSAVGSATYNVIIGTATTVTYQQGVNGYAGNYTAAISDLYTTDAWDNGQGISMIPSMLVNEVTSGTGSYRSLVKFTNLGIPSNAEIQSATMGITFTSWAATGTVTGYYLAVPWNGTSTSNLNWAKRDVGVPWNSPGASGVGTDQIAGESIPVPLAGLSSGSHTLNLNLDPAVVQSWATNPDNGGVMFVESVPGGSTTPSSNTATPTSYRPSLTITYIVRSAAAAPTFSPVSGTYGGVQPVTITSTTPSTTIYYTTDGSIPTTSSAVYTGPVIVSASGTLQAIAVATGYTNSTAASAAYVINRTATTATFQQGANGYAGNYTADISDLYTTSSWNNGQGIADIPGMLVSQVTSGVGSYRSLIKFTGMGIPSYQTVLSATLTLTLTSYNPGTVTGYYLAVPWNGTSTTALTWANRDTGIPWNSPGANGVGTDQIAGKSIPIPLASLPSGTHTLTLTLDPTVVQSWISNPDNGGIMLLESVPGSSVTPSNNAATPVSYRPTLSITYN